MVTTGGRRLALAIRTHTNAIPCVVATSDAHLHIFPCAICAVSCCPTVFTKRLAGFVNRRNLMRGGPSRFERPIPATSQAFIVYDFVYEVLDGLHWCDSTLLELDREEACRQIES